MYFRKMFCIYNLYLVIQNRCNCCIYHKFFFRIVISLLSTLTLYSWLLRSRIKFPIKSTSIHPVKYCMYRSRKQWENVHRPGKIKKEKGTDPPAATRSHLLLRFSCDDYNRWHRYASRL